MVHVIKCNPESPSLLSTNAVCQLGCVNNTLAVAGLATEQSLVRVASSQQSPINQPLINACIVMSKIANKLESNCEDWTEQLVRHANLRTVAPAKSHDQFYYQTDTRVLSTNSNQYHLGDGATRYITISSSENDSFHIFVGDLAPDVEDDLLLATFRSFGSITECKIIKDMHTQKPKGYGFVAYKSKADAEHAIQAMNGQLLGSRIIRTNWAVRRNPAEQAKDHRPLNYVEVFNASSPTNTTIYIGGITTGLNESLLRKAFREFGEIREIRIFKEKGFSFVRFDSHAAATRAIVTMHGRLVGDVPCKCSWSKEPAHSNRTSSVTPPFIEKSLLDSGFVGSSPKVAAGIQSLSCWPPYNALQSCIQGVTPTTLSCIAPNDILSNSIPTGPTFIRPDPVIYDPNNLKPNLMHLCSEQVWTHLGYKADMGLTLSNLLGDNTTATALQNGSTVKNDVMKTPFVNTSPTTITMMESGINCCRTMSQLAAPLVPDTLSVPIPGAPTITSSLIAIEPLSERSFVSTYPLMGPCSISNPYLSQLPRSTGLIGLEDTMPQTALSLNTTPQYALSLRSANIMPFIPVSLADLCTANPYRCNTVSPDAVARTALIPNLNGVSLLC